MSNHIRGNWFISVRKLRQMLVVDLEKVVKSPNYRQSTRINAQNAIDERATAKFWYGECY